MGFSSVFVFSSSAGRTASAISKEFPGIVRSASSGFTVGDALRVGLLDMVGEVVSVGELLGLNDGAKDGCIEGDFDVDGNCEGLIEG